MYPGFLRAYGFKFSDVCWRGRSSMQILLMGWHRNNGNFVDFACHPSCKSFYLTFFYLFLEFSAAIPFCHVILLWHRPTKGGSWSIWLPLSFSSMGVFYTLMLCFAFWCQFIVFFNMYHWGSTGSVFNSTPSELIPVILGRLARLLDASFETIAEISRTGAYSHRCLVFFQSTVFVPALIDLIPCSFKFALPIALLTHLLPNFSAIISTLSKERMYEMGLTHLNTTQYNP